MSLDLFSFLQQCFLMITCDFDEWYKYKSIINSHGTLNLHTNIKPTDIELKKRKTYTIIFFFQSSIHKTIEIKFF